jgi:hypothetical protein
MPRTGFEATTTMQLVQHLPVTIWFWAILPATLISLPASCEHQFRPKIAAGLSQAL